MAKVRPLLSLLGLIATTIDCGLVGPTCLAQQHRGTVASLSGEVGAGAMAVHRLTYASQGSQNDVNISWVGQFVAGGPRIRVYATRAECTQFVPPGHSGFGQDGCVNLGGFGGAPAPEARQCVWNSTCTPEISELVQTSLIITNGGGNPDVLVPPEYKLWIVGDPGQGATYTMTITWFSGPDC